MNEKANVSKELNAKHRKIYFSKSLLGFIGFASVLVDIGSWKASLNYQRIGSALTAKASRYPQESRSTHIKGGAFCKSRVRSATLDTWLPEQISFIQSMGNERSNNYWEAELPPNYDRVAIENFIRAKYEEKRWVPRDGKAKSPSRVSGEKTRSYKPEPSSDGHRQMNGTNHVFEERKIARSPITNHSSPASRSSTPLPVKASTPVPVKAFTPVPVKASPALPVKASQQAVHDTKQQEPMRKLEPAVPKAELAKKEETATEVVTPPKVDYATELFNLLCMDDSRGSDSTNPAHDNGWAGFQTAEAKSTPERNGSSNFIESMTQPNLTSPPLEKPQKDANNDIMNLSGKSSMVSPFSVHQQQLAMLSQQQQFLMATAARSGGGSQTIPANAHRPSSNGIHLPAQGWGGYGYQVPGMVMPITDPQNYMQVELLNVYPMFSRFEKAQSLIYYCLLAPDGKQPTDWQRTGLVAPLSIDKGLEKDHFPISLTCSLDMYRPGPVAPMRGMTNTKATMPPPASPVAPTQPAGYYDLSSLAQGMYTKQ
ncbi:unnamed protein product [Dovyalis caffra]|uniref:Arf-GAP domain-containing protein n=1 Tax=Dovyalis caffra TaxID=77055 RepID=A0AAV1SKB1_9ROSI|nr:unnamed protein product [Dovyalis caffra]